MSVVRKLDYIDAARGLAVLGVVLVHCSFAGRNNYPATLQNILADGALGVQLFFVISAFTLFLSMHERAQRGGESVRNFFVRRFFRIAPMYYLGIGYFLFQHRLSGEPVSGGTVLSNLLFLHGFNPYDMRWTETLVSGGWSIAVEVQFYCLVPFLFRWITSLNRAVGFFLLTVVLNILLRKLLAHLHPMADQAGWLNYLDVYLPAQLPVFACGIMAYFLMVRPTAGAKIHPLVLGVAVLLAFIRLVTNKPYVLPDHILFSLVFAGLLYVLSERHVAVLVNPVTQYLGRISFSMYLVHFAVIYWLEQGQLVDFVNGQGLFASLINFAIRFALVLSLTVLVSTVTYRVIEQPFQRLSRRFIQTNRQPEAVYS